MSSPQDELGRTQDGVRISFAQNGEDVRLWRALDEVDQGYYVEVGGWDPVEHSVSRSFYLRGWAGLVLEPVAEHCERFTAVRPQDQVLQVVASSQDGYVDFHCLPGTGLSTSSGVVALRHAAAGMVEEVRRLPSRTLAGLLQEHAPSEIHFMTIDVEGAELDVLQGMDFGRFRPWILVIEATEPGTPTVTSLDWEQLVLDAGYAFAGFDGLNRYYVADEHSELVTAVAVSPNVFDRFRTAEWAVFVERERQTRSESEAKLNAAWVEGREREQTLQAMLQQSRLRLAETQSRAERAAAEAERATAILADVMRQRDALQASLDGVVASRSWRVTKPLRRVARG